MMNIFRFLTKQKAPVVPELPIDELLSGYTEDELSSATLELPDVWQSVSSATEKELEALRKKYENYPSKKIKAAIDNWIKYGYNKLENEKRRNNKNLVKKEILQKLENIKPV